VVHVFDHPTKRLVGGPVTKLAPHFIKAFAIAFA
jgi:hypothetical protein